MDPRMAPIVSLEAFLRQPLDDIRAVAPETVIYGVAGTRRSAALANVNEQSQDFPVWLLEQMTRCLALILDHGVHHLIIPLLVPGSFREETPGYREHLWRWLDLLTTPSSLADFTQRGWWVRMLYSEVSPRLARLDRKLQRATAGNTAGPGIWFSVVEDFDLPYRHLMTVLKRPGVNSVEDAVVATFGRQVPPAELFLCTGKPRHSPAVAAPLAVRGELECYWTQRPGYTLDAETLRTLLYDFAFLRSTWRPDKRGRAVAAVAHRELWENAPILGVGERRGSFWFPRGV